MVLTANVNSDDAAIELISNKNWTSDLSGFRDNRMSDEIFFHFDDFPLFSEQFYACHGFRIAVHFDCSLFPKVVVLDLAVSSAIDWSV